MHEFLWDHHILVLIITVPLMLWYGRVIVAHLTHGGARTEPMTSPSGRGPAGQPKPVVRVDVNRPAPQADPRMGRGRAPTDKIGTPIPAVGAAASSSKQDNDDEAMNDLFAGVTEAPEVSDRERQGLTGTGAIRNAGRMEELGLHHGIEGEKVPPVSSVRAEPGEKTARIAQLTTPKDPTQPTTAPRGSTGPELDAILARIDKVLSEDNRKTEADPKPAPGSSSRSHASSKPTEYLSTMPATGALAPKPVVPPVASTDTTTVTDNKKGPQAPLWARADAFDEDIDEAPKQEPGTQLGLFDGEKK